MNSKLAKRIQEIFPVSEIIMVNEEAITHIYKVRENADKFSIKENELKEYLEKFAPSDCQACIHIIIQKISTEEDNRKDEILRLSSLR